MKYLYWAFDGLWMVITFCHFLLLLEGDGYLLRIYLLDVRRFYLSWLKCVSVLKDTFRIDCSILFCYFKASSSFLVDLR